MTVSNTPCQEKASEEVRQHHCPKDRRKWVLIAAILASALGFIDGSIVSIAVPAIRSGLNASFVEIQWIMNGYVLFLAALILPGGALGDRFGQRDVFAAGIVLFVIASLWCGLSRSPEELIIARMAKGIGAAAMVPGSLALISRNYPKEERGRAIGIWSAAAGLTTAGGPLIGGWILQAGGEEAWRWLFFINLPLGAIALALIFLRVPRDPGQEGKKVDITGAVLITLALSLIAWGLTVASEGRNADPVMIALALVAGLVMLAAFGFWERRTDHPMAPLNLFSSPAFTGANILTLTLYMALSGIMFFAPMTLIEVHDIPEAQVGAIFIPFTIVMAALSSWAGGLSDKVGTRMPLSVGPVITGIAFLIFAWAVPAGHFWTGVMPGMVVLGIGMGLAVPPLSTAVMTAAPDQYAGAASGINNAIARMAGLFAVAGLGIIAGLVFNTVIADSSLPMNLQKSLIGAGFGEGTDAGRDAIAIRNEAMARGFRAVALLTAGLAFASAIIGRLTQPAK